MSLLPGPRQILASARPFFQEYHLDLLDVEQYTALILERILADGNRAEVRWLLVTYGRDQACRWLAEAGARRLSRRRYPLPRPSCYNHRILSLEEKRWPR